MAMQLYSVPQAARKVRVPEHDARGWCDENGVGGRYVLTDVNIEQMRSDFAESDDEEDDADDEEDGEQGEDAADSVDDEDDDDEDD